MKMQVYYSDGVFRGGNIDTDSLSALRNRVWHGRPHPGCKELLVDVSGFGKPVYEGCWLVIREAITRDIEGPSGDEFDRNSHAYILTSPEVEAWFLHQNLRPPPDIVVLARRFNGETPDSVTPADDAGADQILTDAQLEVWELLKGKALTAKELGNRVKGAPVTEDSIRKRIQAIRNAGMSISTKRGRGYYRPDTPPEDERESV